MSQDHKPTDPNEYARIYAANDFVRMGRVHGALAVARALGDYDYKKSTTKTNGLTRRLPPEKQPVSCEPDVKVHKRVEGDEMLIIACDGIWDVMGNQTCSDFIESSLMKSEGDFGKAMEMTLDECLRLESTDNMSILAVKL